MKMEKLNDYSGFTMFNVKRNADTKRNVWQGKNIAFNEQGLLSVNEFKNIKMITELQKRFEADAYKQKMNYAGSAGIAAEQGFLAGIDFLQHLLQQTPCTTHVCPICNGTGEVQQTDTDFDDCRRCNGSGQIA